VFGKLFERLVCDVVIDFILPVIHDSQHGFLKGKSTLTNLIEYSSFIRMEMAKACRVDSIYTDFSSAFDVVDHPILLFKLNRYGIRGNLLNWFQSYLSNRQQRVNFLGSLSEPIYVKSGVPQGSIAGPLLFVIFINDLSMILKNCKVIMYADDLKLYCSVDHPEAQENLQSDLSKLHEWSVSNGMFLNVKKCATITFSRKRESTANLYEYKIDNECLKRVDQIRDLGVIFDSKLTFKQHVDKITSCAYVALGFVKRRVKELDDPFLNKRLYSALVQPILEYASIVWAPYRICDSKRIESVQKQFLIFALKHLGFSGFKLPKYENRLLLLDMTTLERRRELASTVFLFDLVEGNIRCPELLQRIQWKNNRYNTRNNVILNEERHQSDYTYYDPIATAIRLFNKHSAMYVAGMSRDKFKAKVLSKFKDLSSG